MIRRHVEWVNIWNANCDSDKPRTKRELLRDLDSWEHSQGGFAKENTGPHTSLMAKDFDARAYAQTNKDDFSKLIEQARQKAKAKAEEPTTSNEARSTDAEAKQDNVESTTTAHDPADSSPTQPQSRRQSNPYENNETALASVRAKVKALNKGEEIEPLQNQDFRSSNEQPETTLTQQTPGSQSAPPVADQPALLSQAHFGASHSRAGNVNHGGAAQEACHLPEHLRGTPFKKVPMFEVPQDPVADVDNEPTGQ